MTGLLIFGGGYLGQAVGRMARDAGMNVAATSRSPEGRAALQAMGFVAIDPADEAQMASAARTAPAVLVTAQPDAQGCPGLRAVIPALSRAGAWPDWVGYVSSTAVYGDRNGGWAFEDDALNAATVEGARRVKAEAGWLDIGRGMGLTVQLFRLSAIYGPGRSVVDRLRDGRARLTIQPGQVFNRIHVEDAARAILASIRRPRPGGIYNLTDDAPSPAEAVIRHAAGRLGLPLPPQVDLDDPSVSEAMRRFYLDNKRVSNARAKAELGWRPAYPSWREGLEAVLAAD